MLAASILNLRLGSLKRGFLLSQSIASTLSTECGVSVSKERPDGENATSAVPSFAAVWTKPSSGLRTESEYSDGTAATWWTDAARRSENGAISKNPNDLIFLLLQN